MSSRDGRTTRVRIVAVFSSRSLEPPSSQCNDGSAYWRATRGEVSSVALLGVGISVAATPSYEAVGAAFVFCASVLVGTIPLLAIVAQGLLGLRAWNVARTLVGLSVAVTPVTALYAAGVVIRGGHIGALTTGGLATAAYAAPSFLWGFKPRERPAPQAIAAQA